jgi:hypothetical protein
VIASGKFLAKEKESRYMAEMVGWLRKGDGWTTEISHRGPYTI